MHPHLFLVLMNSRMEAENQAPRDVDDCLSVCSAELKMNLVQVEAVFREELSMGISVEALVE